MGLKKAYDGLDLDGNDITGVGGIFGDELTINGELRKQEEIMLSWLLADDGREAKVSTQTGYIVDETQYVAIADNDRDGNLTLVSGDSEGGSNYPFTDLVLHTLGRQTTVVGSTNYDTVDGRDYTTNGTLDLQFTSNSHTPYHVGTITLNVNGG